MYAIGYKCNMRLQFIIIIIIIFELQMGFYLVAMLLQ
jgi:hypothetical protein